MLDGGRRLHPHRLGAVSCLALAAALLTGIADARADEAFEKSVRPLLVRRCLGCHGAKKQQGGLRLDSRSAAVKGGDSGPAVVAGKPGESLLLQRVSDPDDSARMPPADSGRRLTAVEVEALSRWIASGAPWPRAAKLAPAPDRRAGARHWAFQPVRRPDPPDDPTDWSRSPVDRFVFRRLRERNLAPAPEADRRTLIRRVTYDLTGLPPTPDEVEAFVADESPDAYARLVDRLLESPHYGEQWGRHWLDVARYSDTKGYVYAREEKNFVHAATYRDWVVAAFQNDVPYDRFLLLQLAADQLVEEDSPDLAAMGFLTLGRRFLGVTPDIVDDRIDVVTRGTLGLTVTCARCHDHEYDPLPTADYYSLYGVFENSVERLVPIGDAANSDPPPELADLQRKLSEAIAKRSAEAGQRVRRRIADYLHAQRSLEEYPVQGFDQVLSKDDLIPAIVHRFERYLAAAADRDDPVFVPWHAYAKLPEDGFAAAAKRVTKELHALPSGAVNPRILEAFADPPASPRQVAERYARVLHEADRAWQALREKSFVAFPGADDDALRRFLYGPGSPCVVPDEPIVNTESLYDSGTVNELWKLQNAVDRWLLKSSDPSYTVILEDRAHVRQPRIFRRGNAARPGETVPLRFLEILSGPDRRPFQHGSGRLELARAIASPRNPLTARVWVNRVWRHHFGAGLVTTPSDFGLRASPPSHPQLLDWLAAEFVENGWSTKDLHRRLLLSATYRQVSNPRDSDEVRRARKLDPANRLLWRMNARRLGYEEFRDTLLAVSGDLDLKLGGKPVQPFAGGAPQRRSLYGRIDRQFVPDVLRVFDFANPDLHSPKRSETTVPQQALFALNHPFVAARARSLAGLTEASSATEDRVSALFRRVFQRTPSTAEVEAAAEFLSAAKREAAPPQLSRAARAWSYGYGELDEEAGRLKAFHPLPHFTGSAWQGGPKWPDSKLGWVQLTATGGHAGNDLRHAAVRRWKADRDGTVRVKSKAVHDVDKGDGIRCWIVSSQHGVLASATLKNGEQRLDLADVAVRAGDTLDFVVDYNANLNSDQFQWAPEVTAVTPADGKDVARWSAREDFAGPPRRLLTPWEQLAQVLLLSNELYFVD